MLSTISTINAQNKVDVFNYKLNIYIVDCAIIVNCREKIIEKICKNINKPI